MTSETRRVFETLRLYPRNRVLAEFTLNRVWIGTGFCENCRLPAMAYLYWHHIDGGVQESLSCLAHLDGCLEEAWQYSSDVIELEVDAFAPRYLLNQIDYL